MKRLRSMRRLARVLLAGGSLTLGGVAAFGVWRTAHVAQTPAPAPVLASVGLNERDRKDGGIRAISLIDFLDTAVIEGPSAEVSVKRFHAVHWRSMRAPWNHLTSSAKKRVEFVALTTSATERTAPEAAAGGWHPDLQTWNMAEGSFDAREAIVLPPPSTMRLTVRVPRGAWLECSPAVLGLRTGSVTFEVFAARKGKEPDQIASVKISAGAPPRWHETRVALEAYADQEIELAFRTKTSFVGDPPTALWGTPTVYAPAPAAATVPFNVVWIVVDALRPDAMASFHTPRRDARTEKAELSPLEAVLPAMPSVVPNLDALAARGVAFVDATSAASWTRPGTLAMLTGMRSGELGLDSTSWILPDASVGRFYATAPPLIALAMRGAGVRTKAIVNNYFLTGYARAGLDTGFAAMVDHRDETRDTERIVRDARAFLTNHGDSRFFLFLNFNSPHHPYEPGLVHARQVPKPPTGPKHKEVRAYLGEIAKDDEAIGAVAAELDRLSLREKTLVVVTADHGETLSAAHDLMVPDLDQGTKPMRFHHANAMFEETARIPLLVSLPGTLPEGLVVDSPVQNTDIVPTILALEGMPNDPRQSGRSLLPLTKGAAPEPDRPIVTEGRAARAIRVGKWRYVERDAAAQHVTSPKDPSTKKKEELYDLDADPGERRDRARELPDVTAQMREALAKALEKSVAPDARKSAALAGSRHTTKEEPHPSRLHLRFAGGGKSRRFTVSIELPAPEKNAPLATWRTEPWGLDPQAIQQTDRQITVSLTTPRAGATTVGFDLLVDPPATPLSWAFTLDDEPFASTSGWLFAGPWGLAAPSLLGGLRTADERLQVTSETAPYIDPQRDLGVFLTRDPAGDLAESVRPTSDAALKEVGALLEAWGYANKAAVEPAP
jgi:arylsulfatase A-like enzyme